MMEKHSKPLIIVSPPGPKSKKFIERDEKITSPSLTRTAPLVGVEAEDVWVKDADGNVYLDFGSGIAVVNVGHRHPKVVEAIKKQVDLCDHINSCDYFTIPQIELGEKLVALTPGKYSKRIFFGNSGTEAVECALKIAKWHTKRQQFICFIGAFHGRTMGSLACTSTSFSARRYYFPMMPGPIPVPYGYCYRCLYKQQYPECGLWCVGYIEDVILKKLVAPEEVAGILVEPIQGAGGAIVPPDDFLIGLKKLCKSQGILFIDDEVQTGFGRTGKMWACEHLGIVPDIMCMSKAIAGGLPMGACVASSEIMDWSSSSHENTLGGNPIVVAAAIAVIDIIEKEHLVKKTSEIGEYMLKRLTEIQEKHPLIGDVRGKGLMIGIEFVKDRKTKAPAVKERDDLILETFKRGLLTLGAGPCSMRIMPPLILKKEQADVGLGILEEALNAVEK